MRLTSPAAGNRSIAGNPLDYGAVYDGVTDCSKAINDCIAKHDRVVFSGGEGIALCQSPVIVRSNTWLDLDWNFTIKLADNVDCELIKNRWAEQAYFTEKNGVPGFINEVYPNFDRADWVLGEADTNIKITGGILDGNGANQTRHHTRYGCYGYRGVLLVLVHVKGLVIKDIFMYDPNSYNAEFCKIDNFEVRNMRLDYRQERGNIDGIHFNGECRNGIVENIWGRTNDDMVALNGGDCFNPKNSGLPITPELDKVWYPFCQGRIENISIKNIFATDGFRAVRLLANSLSEASVPGETEGMNGITIDGIYGTYRWDILIVSGWIGVPKVYDNIVIKNINAAVTKEIKGTKGYIWTENVIIKNITIENFTPADNGIAGRAINIGGTVEKMTLVNCNFTADFKKNNMLTALPFIEAGAGNAVKQLVVDNCNFISDINTALKGNIEKLVLIKSTLDCPTVLDCDLVDVSEDMCVISGRNSAANVFKRARTKNLIVTSVPTSPIPGDAIQREDGSYVFNGVEFLRVT
ncbi:MAG: glycosyl hydrolase family 28 protein [Candidatus Omnitrophica bacterium]|nr:glycosyl hydrolase family 28 protein [Candidatus Omnitrophota bacterium]